MRSACSQSNHGALIVARGEETLGHSAFSSVCGMCGCVCMCVCVCVWRVCMRECVYVCVTIWTKVTQWSGAS